MKKTAIGFVGVGRMGANMARHLADLGYEVTAVCDQRETVASSLALELGCAAVRNLPEVTASAEIIFTVVTDDASMRNLFGGSNSLLKNARGKVFINCATASPGAHEAAEEAAVAAGAMTLVAGVGASMNQARHGTLYLIVGGDFVVFQRYESVLADMSSAVRYVGSAGNAAKIKALANMVMNINTAGLAEGLGLGAALGIDLQVLKEVFCNTGADSRVLNTDGDDMILREHPCHFAAVHAAKDSGIANSLATAAGVPVPLSHVAEEQYRKLVGLGLGELDKSAISELTFPDRAGIL
jgi:3-hydroxyisobutyrate dehydrogenase